LRYSASRPSPFLLVDVVSCSFVGENSEREKNGIKSAYYFVVQTIIAIFEALKNSRKV
jgi:hypothetical protein